MSINDDITPSSFRRRLESRRGMPRWRGDGGFCRMPALGYRARGHARCAGRACLNHWIPVFAGMTEEDSGLRRAAAGVLGGLFQTPFHHLGRWFQTRLYRLRPVGAPSRRNDDLAGITVLQAIDSAPR